MCDSSAPPLARNPGQPSLSSPASRPVRNRLLARLAEEERTALQSRLERIELIRGNVLIIPHSSIDHAYFPEGGLGSTLAVSGGRSKTEIGMIGLDGFVGVPLALGDDRSPHETVVQIGGPAWRIAAPDLRRVMADRPALHRLLLEYAHAFLIQTGQTAYSNARHRLEQRLARWLLMAQDRVERAELGLTHDYLAIMLGVHRPGVTVALHALEAAGLVRARRASITVRDRRGLEALAGEAYGLAEAQYTRLIGA